MRLDKSAHQNNRPKYWLRLILRRMARIGYWGIYLVDCPGLRRCGDRGRLTPTMCPVFLLVFFCRVMGEEWMCQKNITVFSHSYTVPAWKSRLLRHHASLWNLAPRDVLDRILRWAAVQGIIGSTRWLLISCAALYERPNRVMSLKPKNLKWLPGTGSNRRHGD